MKNSPDKDLEVLPENPSPDDAGSGSRQDKSSSQGLPNKVATQVHKTLSQPSGSKIIDQQIEALEGVSRALKNSQERIQEAQAGYQKALREAFEQGVDRSIIQKYYVDYLSRNETSLSAVINRIEERHIPYIEKLINELISIKSKI